MEVSDDDKDDELEATELAEPRILHNDNIPVLDVLSAYNDLKSLTVKLGRLH